MHREVRDPLKSADEFVETVSITLPKKNGADMVTALETTRKLMAAVRKIRWQHKEQQSNTFTVYIKLAIKMHVFKKYGLANIEQRFC